MTAQLRQRLLRVNTLLFDLDGTLLGNDINVFLGHYFPAATAAVGRLVDPGCFLKQLLASTQEMVDNDDPGVSNAEAFAANFYASLGLDRATSEPLFAEFYAREFPKLRVHTQAKPAARRLLDVATAKGYGLVLATNPVFPAAATEERMRWAGIDSYPWQLVTTYENMHFCKPQPGYYQEILVHIAHAAGVHDGRKRRRRGRRRRPRAGDGHVP
jgi:FMN phosphatase YigB (HAD superfamily)